jgi:hypothetical protein
VNASRALLLAVVALACAGAAWLTRDVPRTNPPLATEIANSVTSFAVDHPEWPLLREPRKDAATVRLNHARHLDPSAPGMQDALRALVDDPDAHVRTVPSADGDLLSLSCASCHAPDDAGAYMRPVRFDTHCVRCHEDQLLRVPTFSADGEEVGARVPHGDVEAVVTSVERALAARAALAESRFAPAEGAASQESTSPSRRGRRGGASSPDDVPAFATRAEAVEWLDRQRLQVLTRAKDNCGYCHTTAAIATEPNPAGSFSVSPPRIPAMWLPASWYSHKSHEMLACTACHAQAELSRDTGDILIPGIATCRECHSPSAGAPSNCTLCHLYHERNPYLEGGALGIEQFTGLGHEGDAPRPPPAP